MDERAYYQLHRGYREPETVDEYEYFIKKLYRQTDIVTGKQIGRAHV